MIYQLETWKSQNSRYSVLDPSSEMFYTLVDVIIKYRISRCVCNILMLNGFNRWNGWNPGLRWFRSTSYQNWIEYWPLLASHNKITPPQHNTHRFVGRDLAIFSCEYYYWFKWCELCMMGQRQIPPIWTCNVMKWYYVISIGISPKIYPLSSYWVFPITHFFDVVDFCWYWIA